MAGIEKFINPTEAIVDAITYINKFENRSYTTFSEFSLICETLSHRDMETFTRLLTEKILSIRHPDDVDFMTDEEKGDYHTDLLEALTGLCHEINIANKENALTQLGVKV